LLYGGDAIQGVRRRDLNLPQARHEDAQVPARSRLAELAGTASVRSRSTKRS
jgi:hypothetical protein